MWHIVKYATIDVESEYGIHFDSKTVLTWGFSFEDSIFPKNSHFSKNIRPYLKNYNNLGQYENSTGKPVESSNNGVLQF